MLASTKKFFFEKFGEPRDEVGDNLFLFDGGIFISTDNLFSLEIFRKSGATLQLTVQPILELSELSNRKASAAQDKIAKNGSMAPMNDLRWVRCRTKRTVRVSFCKRVYRI